MEGNRYAETYSADGFGIPESSEHKADTSESDLYRDLLDEDIEAQGESSSTEE